MRRLALRAALPKSWGPSSWERSSWLRTPWLWLALLWLCAAPAWAQSRAWLSSDRIALDDAVTLTLEIDASTASGVPDLAGLARDFRVLDQRMGQQVSLENGEVKLRVTMQMVLQPLRQGVLEIPMIRIGQDATPPLRLTVLPPKRPQSVAPPPPPNVSITPSQPIFIESGVETATPYVQQTVGYTVRLYYEFTSMIDGRLDQDPPEGASLQKIGEDAVDTRRFGNRLYNVVERRFLLIPERGGRVVVPPPRFLGRGLDPFGGALGGRTDMRVRGNPTELQVRPIPANAAQPWLPLRGLRLRWLETPQSLRVGETAHVAIELSAEGAVASQMPALSLEAGEGVQVFPDPVQAEDRFVDGGSRTTVVRRFSLLPAREGDARIVGPRIAWWDAQAGAPRSAALPDLRLSVAPAAPAAAASALPAGDPVAERGSSWRPQRLWAWMLLPLAALWIVFLLWAGRLWMSHRAAGAAAKTPALRAHDAQAWSRALARGDRAELARMLCAMAPPPAADLDAVRERLADPAQRAAVTELQRARWGRGDAAAAIAAMRSAFAAGPRWRMPVPGAAAPAPSLPPLYPAR